MRKNQQNREIKRDKKNKVSKIGMTFMIVSIIGVLVWAGLFSINYAIGEDTQTNIDGTKSDSKEKKNEINALVCGVNDNLTDTILYVKYFTDTGKISMMSVPRDTYITNEYCIGNKINAIYRGKNIVPLVEEVQELLDVKIDYYLIFEADMLIDLVDAVGGIEVDVPMNMKYDDKTQNLHINLKKGTQVLNGKQAEHFVRFRHNNDGTGYAMGDLERTKVQQAFIKTFISSILSTKNITKIPELIDIALKNTDTNITAREALKYVTDASKIDIQNMNTLTAPGAAEYRNNLSYFIMDEEEARRVIKEEFVNIKSVETPPQEDTTIKK